MNVGEGLLPKLSTEWQRVHFPVVLNTFSPRAMASRAMLLGFVGERVAHAAKRLKFGPPAVTGVQVEEPPEAFGVSPPVTAATKGVSFPSFSKTHGRVGDWASASRLAAPPV